MHAGSLQPEKIPPPLLFTTGFPASGEIPGDAATQQGEGPSQQLSTSDVHAENIR